ncbi:MAG: ABC transporter substrate-binding protein [Acidimicrobiia bacterium]|nr:MAG: ABC transporter substrate-binding protein [Acidimicrobiia bacterium]
MKYRLLTLLAVIALVAAACSSSGDDEATTTTAGDTGGGGDSAEVIDIDFWVAFSDEKRLGFAEDRAAEFNTAHPDYNIKVTSFASYNDVFDAAVLAADTGEPPALIHFFEAATREALDAVDGSGNPLFKSVTEAIAGRTEILGEPIVLDNVVSAARDYYTVDGSFYSMPWNTSSTVLLSNMSILEAAGITEPPGTWGEVTAACEKIMGMADAPAGCISWPNHSWFAEQALGQQGELLANNDNGRTDRATEVFIDSPGMIAYVSWMQDLQDAGYYTYTGLQRDWGGVDALFLAEDIAMQIDSSSDTLIHQAEAADLGFDYKTSFMPFNENVDYVGNLIGGATIWMLDGMDQAKEDGALAFMNFFSNPANAAAWHQLTGYIPITDDAVDLLNSEGWYDEAPNAKVASDQLAAAKNTPASLGALIGNFVAIRDIITLAIEDILVNDLDVATRLGAANTEANASLTEYEQLFGG